MKKMGCAMLVGALVLAVPGVSGAVDLLPDCGLVYNGISPTPDDCGFDATASALFILLSGLGVEGMPATWQQADLETLVPGGDIVGDGVPDWFQMGMLGAVICSGEGTIGPLFDANKSNYNDFVSAINNLLTAADAVDDNLIAYGGELQTYANTLPAGPTRDAMLAAAQGLIDAGNDIQGIVDDYGIYATQLPTFQNLFAGMGGLSTEMQNTIVGLVNDDLVGELTQYATDLETAANGLTTIIAALPSPAQDTLIGHLTQLQTDALALVDILNNLSLGGLSILDRGKSADEDFSAFGDYNADGVSNLDTYTGVTRFYNYETALNQRAWFVYWATGTAVFPGAPLAGLMGLAALAGAFAIGGGMALRKK